jgi:hypothetical protein
MAELSRHDQERIEKLLRLCITCLSVGQDIAYIKHRLLNRIGMPFFVSLSDEECADHNKWWQRCRVGAFPLELEVS